MKFVKVFFTTTAILIMVSLTAFAGTWRTGSGVNKDRWWYDNGNSTYANNGWYWISNGNVEKCYYFDANGWMLANTITPDGQQVNANGEWILNGIVQNKAVPTSNKKVDYKGSYQIKGEEYIWVNQYYMKDGALYIEGEYCDGVRNPNPTCEADYIIYSTIKENVRVIIDNNTIMSNAYDKNINDIKTRLDDMFNAYHNAVVHIRLDGDHVAEYLGSRCNP